MTAPGTPTPPATEERPDFGLAASTPGGRFLLSLLLVALTGSLFAWNLPDWAGQDSAQDPVRPLMVSAGLEQNWALFAPNPTRLSIEMVARVELADGSSELFFFPSGDPFVGTFREYRWRKFERRVRLDSYSRHWGPAAAWVARQIDGDIERVVLIRRWAESPEPGSGGVHVWEESEFFTLEDP